MYKIFFDFKLIKSQDNIWDKEINKVVHTPKTTIMTFDAKSGWSFNDKGHVSEQITIVLGGVIEFEVGEKKMILKSGQGVYIPPFIEHSGKLISKTAKGIDIFAPGRNKKKYQGINLGNCKIG